jgi:Raf kinase inhibitor-like YbhB/YbcL family protein
VQLSSQSFASQQPIPARCAFGQPGMDGPFAFGGNASPHLVWSDVPEDTRSFALACIDVDVPSRGDDVNQPDRVVPADLPRVEFTHWLMIDIDAGVRDLAEGQCGSGIVAHGKRRPPGPIGSRQGINDYTHWFADDADMAGDYYGYDGPCPPWNDSIVHHYGFHVYALKLARLDLPARFDLADLRRSIDGQVLAHAVCVGTYSMRALS